MNKYELILIASVGIFTYIIVYFLIVDSKYGLKPTRRRVEKLADAKSITDFKKDGGIFASQGGESMFSFIRASEKLRRYLIASGVRLKPEEYLLIWLIAALLPALLYYLFKGFSLTVIALIFIGVTLPPILVEQSRKKRLKIFNEQLNEALVIISNSLRTGFTFRYAIARVSEDLPDPISEELKRVVREINYGANIEDALDSLAQRMESREFAMINSAVTIQQRSGGNLAEIIEKVSETISDRVKIRNQVATLTAQGRYSGMIIGLLPLFILLILMVISPSYVSVFFETAFGRLLLIIEVILELVGFYIIKKIVTIDV
jgi:tight adherence protein B